MSLGTSRYMLLDSRDSRLIVDGWSSIQSNSYYTFQNGMSSVFSYQNTIANIFVVSC